MALAWKIQSGLKVCAALCLSAPVCLIVLLVVFAEVLPFSALCFHSCAFSAVPAQVSLSALDLCFRSSAISIACA